MLPGCHSYVTVIEGEASCTSVTTKLLFLCGGLGSRSSKALRPALIYDDLEFQESNCSPVGDVAIKRNNSCRVGS